MKQNIWLVLALLSVTASVQAASFDCGKAQSNVEKLICDSNQLSQLDENLDRLYKEAQNTITSNEKQQLILEQRQWLKDSRNKCDDEPCLHHAYSFRIESIKSIQSSNANDPFTKTDVFSEKKAPVGKGYPTIGRSIDGDLVYTHYDDSGNSKNIVQLDFTTGRWFNLVEGKRDPKLVAQDSRYIVFHTPHSASFPIEVVNRKTGASLSKIKLKTPVREAFIEGNHLVLFQASPEPPYGYRQAIAIFKLPSLKLIQETSIPGGSLISLQSNRIYTAYSANAAMDLIVHDHQFKELGRMKLPPPIEKLNSYCQPQIVKDENDRALLIANCGEMHVLDLKSFSVERSIPRHSLFYSVALYKGLIFTTTEKQNGIVVFDMDTGKEIARLPIYATSIAIKGNTLLAAGTQISTGREISWPLDTYQINAEAIRSGKWQIERVLEQCKQAETHLAKTGDLYGAIGSCKTAGVEGLIDKAASSPSIYTALKQYALWLSRTLDKGRDAIRVFEKLQLSKSDGEIVKALNEARLKTKVIEEGFSGDLTTAELSTDFGRIVSKANPLINPNTKMPEFIARTKDIEFGAFPELFHFSDDRIYIGRYGCGGCIGGDASIGILDRNTLNEVATISIAPADDEYQDNIASITSDETNLYVSTAYRYEQEGRPNFFVIDKKTNAIIRKGQLSSANTLIFEGNKLLSCTCHFTEDQQCVLINPVTMKTEEIRGKYCVRNEHGSKPVIGLRASGDTSQKYVAVTKEYLVAHDSWPKGSPYTFYPISGEQPTSIKLEIGDGLEWPISVEGNSILIGESTLGGRLIKLVKLPSGEVKTLCGLPTNPSKNPIGLLHKNSLYVGYGRDLLILDIETHILKRYIKDFIVAEMHKKGDYRADEHQIRRLIIDQEKLIALTHYGKKSRIVQLSDL